MPATSPPLPLASGGCSQVSGLRWDLSWVQWPIVSVWVADFAVNFVATGRGTLAVTEEDTQVMLTSRAEVLDVRGPHKRPVNSSCPAWRPESRLQHKKKSEYLHLKN